MFILFIVLVIVLIIPWFVIAGKAEDSRVWRNVSNGTNFLMFCFIVYLFSKDRFLYGFILMLIWWWITFVKSDEWKQVYAFTNWFMILFLVSLFVIGPIIGVYTVPDKILNASHPGSYFKHLLNTSIVTGIIIGFIAGLIALTDQMNKEEKSKK